MSPNLCNKLLLRHGNKTRLPTNESCLILTISLWNSILRSKIGYEPYLFFTRSQIEQLLFYKLVDSRENLI